MHTFYDVPAPAKLNLFLHITGRRADGYHELQTVFRLLDWGDTVRLRAENKGKVLHEIVLGTKAELDQHAQMMRKFPGMEHDEPYMAHIAPGQSGEMIWTFNRTGEFDFACLIAGHYQAGMVGTIRVLAE